jgi:hypothetical protein
VKPEQKIVAIGAASGIAAMIVAVWVLTRTLPVPTVEDTAGARLAYALRANVFALVPFFVMLVTVANKRFLSDAIDPTRNAESAEMGIDGRVAENTLQQQFIFAVASLALSTIVPLHYLQVVWACAIWFVVARCLFWFGYRKHPLYRAPGMSGTLYMNLFMILYIFYRLVAG